MNKKQIIKKKSKLFFWYLNYNTGIGKDKKNSILFH